MRLSHGSLQSTKTQGMVLERGSWPVSTCCIYQLFGGRNMKGVHCGYKYVFYNVWKYWYLVIVSIIKTARLEFIRYYSQSSWFDFFFYNFLGQKLAIEKSDKKVLWTVVKNLQSCRLLSKG